MGSPEDVAVWCLLMLGDAWWCLFGLSRCRRAPLFASWQPLPLAHVTSHDPTLKWQFLKLVHFLPMIPSSAKYLNLASFLAKPAAQVPPY